MVEKAKKHATSSQHQEDVEKEQSANSSIEVLTKRLTSDKRIFQKDLVTSGAQEAVVPKTCVPFPTRTQQTNKINHILLFKIKNLNEITSLAREEKKEKVQDIL